jgi:hypothetical protein
MNNKPQNTSVTKYQIAESTLKVRKGKRAKAHGSQFVVWQVLIVVRGCHSQKMTVDQNTI